MSYTGRFSPMYPLDETDPYDVGLEFSKHGCGVRVTDFDGLKENLNSTLFNQAVMSDYTDRSEYPNQVWKKFNGFVTFGNAEDVNDYPRYYNVSKLGWRYKQARLVETMETLAEHLEPFMVWHYAGDSYFPSFLQVMNDDHDIYRIEGDGDGNIEVIEVIVGPDVSANDDVEGFFTEDVVYATDEDDDSV